MDATNGTALAQLSLNLQQVTASRYVSAAGLVMLLWDHILTFDREVELMWQSSWNLSTALFLFLRYFVPVGLIMITTAISGVSRTPLSVAYCRGVVSFGMSLGVATVAASNLLVLLRIWSLWGARKAATRVTGGIYAFIQLSNLALNVNTIINLTPSVIYESAAFHSCILTSHKFLFSLWIPGLVFEIAVFLATIYNALDRPRTPDCRLTSALRRDGIVYFVTLTALRLFNLITSAVAPVSLTFLAVYLIWSATTIATCHLVLNLREIENDSKGETGCGITEHEHEQEHIVLRDLLPRPRSRLKKILI